jgi:hypothetical protein
MSLLSSFVDELEKVAFSPADAAKVLKSVKGRTFKGGDRLGLGFATVQSKPQVQRQVHRTIADAEAAGVKGKALQAVRESTEAALTDPESPVHWSRAKAYMMSPAKGDFSRFIRDVGGKSQLKTPLQKRMGEAIVKGHELDELTMANKRMSKNVFLPVGHLSPDVILREHNKIVTSPKPVRDAVYSTMKPFREAESDALSQFGVNYGKSPRFSRHARRRITDMMESQGKSEQREMLQDLANSFG